MSEIDREQWLEDRRKGIGGSDVAGILGISQWASPYSVWADKLGLLPPEEDNERMRQGRDFEPIVADRFCEATGKKVRKVNRILYSKDHPFMLANIDRDIVGEKAGLECKTTSILNLKRFKDGDFPEEYYCQCMHYMAVTGYEKWYLAVIVLGREFYIFEIPRNEDEISTLIEIERDFWKLVESGTPPPVDGLEATKRALEAVNKVDSDEDPVMLYGHEDLISELDELREATKEKDRRSKEIKNILLSELGTSAIGYLRGYEVSRSVVKRSSYVVPETQYTTIRIKERAEI